MATQCRRPHLAAATGHKVIVLKTRGEGAGADGDVEIITEGLVGAELVGADGEIAEAHLQEMVAELQSHHAGDAGDGERVIVTRRIVRDGDTLD